MAKILITGSNGQLGSELQELSDSSAHQMIFTDVAQLDITDSNQTGEFIKENQIDIIINCAAYTAVDNAEDNINASFAVNATAPANLAQAAKDSGASLIHISTDYVFDGTACRPYKEIDRPSPLGVYGKSKLAGEIEVMQSGCNYVIIRTSWLYSTYGNNFVKTIIKHASQKESMSVVFDQAGTPTYAADLAVAILKICDNITNSNIQKQVYHFSNEGVCSWYDFAVEIAKSVESCKECKILPITSDQYPVRAPRPSFSVLDKTKIKQSLKIEIPHWKSSLERCLNKLDNN